VVDGEDRVHEIARMLGGDSESPTSRAHARELIDGAVNAPEAAAAGKNKDQQHPAQREQREHPPRPRRGKSRKATDR